MTEKLKTELDNHQSMRKQILEYKKAGRAKMINKKKVDKAANDLTGLSSNDADIIALAMVSGVKLLVSEDQ